MQYVDLAEEENIEVAVTKALKDSTNLNGIPVTPAIYVKFGHCGHRNEEHYQAFVSWNYMRQEWMMSVEFHGLSNQMKPYLDRMGVASYKKLDIIIRYLKIWAEVPRRVYKWSERNSKKVNV